MYICKRHRPFVLTQLTVTLWNRYLRCGLYRRVFTVWLVSLRSTRAGFVKISNWTYSSWILTSLWERYDQRRIKGRRCGAGGDRFPAI